jgi:predicted amidohydrolase YtcJ
MAAAQLKLSERRPGKAASGKKAEFTLVNEQFLSRSQHSMAECSRF